MNTFEQLTTLQKINFKVSENVTYLRRSYRILNLSVFDYLGSYIVIFLIIKIFNIKYNPMYFALMLPVAVVVHILTGQETQFTNQITKKEGVNASKIWLTFLIFYAYYSYLYFDLDNSFMKHFFK